jgi:hypothetical protein
MRKKVIALLLSCCICTFAFANSVEDARISFSTKGPDCYADGSVVVDGESYALIWSKDGNFDGFDANGECIDPEDKIVLLAPVAKDGRCPPVLFQIPAAEAENLKNGQYAVYLLDTRVSSGGETKAGGISGGRPALMNGYGEASAAIAVAGADAFKSASESGSGGAGIVASSLASVPSDCTQPRIKAIRIEGDNVFLTVENLKGFMRVSSGSDVSASDAATAAVETNGGDEDVTLVTRKPGNSGFFKVIRNGK